MKKLFVIFCCICTLETMPSTLFSLELSMSDTLTLSDDGYHNRGRCTIQTICEPDEEYIYTGEKCYVSDNDGSETFCEQQIVCILGLTEEKEHGYTETNKCWYADVGSSDFWVPVDDKIPECKKYPKTSNKYPVFLTSDGKILSNANGKIAKSIVSSQSGVIWWSVTKTANDMLKQLKQDYNIECIAYISDDDLPGDTSDDSSSDDNSNGSNDDGGNDGGENGGNANAKEPDDNKIHRHTVDPWLKALDAYMSSCKK